MCQDIVNNTASQGPFKGVDPRIARPNIVCKQRAGSQNATPFIADSLASLRLPVINGADVFFAQETKENRNGMEEASFIDMVTNLNDIYKRMAKGLGVEIGAEFPNSNLKLVDQLTIAMEGIKSLLPSPFYFNVEYNVGDGHYITVYAECTCIEQWNVMEIGKLVKKLKKNSPKFHDFFLSFIRSFAWRNGIAFWWQNDYGNTIDYMDEQYSDACSADNENCDGDEQEFYERGMDKKEWSNEIKLYKTGKAFDYQNLIYANEKLSATTLLEQLASFKRPPRGLDELVRIGCEMMTGISNEDFEYMPHDDNDDYNSYLRYDAQYAIVWALMSLTTTQHGESMDADATEGVQQPVWHIEIKKGFDQTIDFEHWESCFGYPEKLRLFFDKAYQIIKDYTK